MKTLKHLDLFSGIGGFAHGLRMAGGFETVAFCEIDGYCQQVLKQNFYNIPVFGDIHDLTANTLRGAGIGDIDIITAGFPCQPFSQAGSQRGTADERFLWPELFRVITDVGPQYIILENVPALLTIQNGLVFAGILFDLAAGGYDVEWQVIPASAVGAWHRRDRLWIVAYANSERCRETGHPSAGTPERISGNGKDVADALRTTAGLEKLDTSGQERKPTADMERTVVRQGNRTAAAKGIGTGREDASDTTEQRLEARTRPAIFGPQAQQRLERFRQTVGWREWSVEPDVGRVAHGIPNRVDRIKALGNAVVPQIVAYIGELILEYRDG